MIMKLTGIILIVTACSHLSSAQTDCLCDNCKGLEKGDPFYNLTSSDSNPRAKRALRGSKRMLAVPVGEKTFTFTIKGYETGSDFNISRLCLWTKNVETIESHFQSMYAPNSIVVEPDGSVNIGATGTAASGNAILIDDPSVWLKSCIVSGVHTLVRINLQAESTEAKMMVKALHMHACPRQIGLPTPRCANSPRRTLDWQRRYFTLEASSKGAEYALNGSRRAVRARPTQKISFTITPPEGDDGFVMTSLCIDTQNVNLLSLEYVGVPSCDGSGGCVGGGLAQTEKVVDEPSDWTHTCIDFTPSMYTKVTLTLNSIPDGKSRVMAKGLVMTGCPWTKGE